jgi:hypothetical protein
MKAPDACVWPDRLQPGRVLAIATSSEVNHSLNRSALFDMPTPNLRLSIYEFLVPAQRTVR